MAHVRQTLEVFEELQRANRVALSALKRSDERTQPQVIGLVRTSLDFLHVNLVLMERLARDYGEKKTRTTQKTELLTLKVFADNISARGRS